MSSISPLAGKVALITGSGGGIGREHALAFARAGARVVVNDPGGSLDGSGESHDPADSVVSEIVSEGGEAIATYNSVADFDDAGSMVERSIEAFGQVDILINNASVFHGCLFDELTEEHWDSQLNVHVKGAFNMCKHALPGMVERGWGRVVNTSSASAFGGVGFAAYSTAKAALLGFTYALADEHQRHGITVNAILPNAGTPHRLVEGEEWMKRVASRGFVPPGVGVAAPPPEFVPPLAIFLASDDGAGVSGTVFDVGGGRVAVYPKLEVVAEIDRPMGQGPWTHDELTRALRPMLPGS
jgi:NAD(P)-dependent dehydrogenase (short-subunit alcohol dehydrogenase family)